MEKLLLRPVEAAEALAIGRSRIYILLAEGELPYIRIGRSVRIPFGALRLWVEAKQEAKQEASSSPSERQEP